MPIKYSIITLIISINKNNRYYQSITLSAVLIQIIECLAKIRFYIVQLIIIEVL